MALVHNLRRLTRVAHRRRGRGGLPVASGRGTASHPNESPFSRDSLGAPGRRARQARRVPCSRVRDATLAIVLALGAAIAASPVSSSGTSTARHARDPALWPFAATSPWNYPIGSHAIYAPVRQGNGTGFTDAYFNARHFTFAVYIARSTDPYVDVIRDDRTETGGPTFVYGTKVFPRHIPAHAVPSPGERQMVIIAPDHLTATEFYGARRDADGNWHNGLVNVDLRGPGWGGDGGWHRGPGGMAIALNTGDAARPWNAIGVPPGQNMTSDGFATAAAVSGLGGLIRPGELRNGIPHALAFATEPYYWNRNAPGGRSFVWPAVSSDDPTPYGTQGNLYFGGLVAIPASVDVNSLGLQTTEGKNVALALQRYGAYARDTADTGPNTLVFYMDYAARGELPTSAAFASDMAIIARHLMVVTNSNNNGGQPTAPSIKIQSPNGDGTLLAPLAPAFDR